MNRCGSVKEHAEKNLNYDEIRKAKATTDQLTNKLQEAEQKLSKALVEIQRVTLELDTLKERTASFDAIAEENCQAKFKIEELERQLKDCNNSSTSANDHFSSCMKQLEAANQAKVNLASVLGDCRSQIQNLADERAKLFDNFKRTEKMLSEKKKVVDDLEKRNSIRSLSSSLWNWLGFDFGNGFIAVVWDFN